MTQPAAGKAAPESATSPAQPVVTDELINPGSTIGGAVGTFYVDFTLWNPGRTRSRVLNALVDTGASILAELGIEPEQTKRFQLANGDTQDFPVGSARMELDGQQENVHIVFGPENRLLLGSMALGAFALAVDAKNHRLIPADLRL